MGICASSSAQQDTHQKEVSDKIDRQIVEDSKNFRKECKILLLGSGEGGKSTIVKQMTIIHKNGFSDQDLVDYRPTIYRNLFESAQDIVRAMIQTNIYPSEPANRGYTDLIMRYSFPSSSSFEYLDPEIITAISSLWKDPVIPKLMDHSSEFYLMDNASYFFNEIDRIGSPAYLPSEADVLRARQTTVGIVETKFTMGQLSIHMFDVGGQRNERKKWIHCFENVTSIIFCIALSEYDQVLLEHTTQNRMDESLILFESVINSRWFLRTSVVLFLNKVDVFKRKVPKIPLERYFPEYTGGPDINKAAKFILWKFMQANKARLNVYQHLTQATDTNNIRLVFAAVKETILTNALKDSGFL